MEKQKNITRNTKGQFVDHDLNKRIAVQSGVYTVMEALEKGKVTVVHIEKEINHLQALIGELENWNTHTQKITRQNLKWLMKFCEETDEILDEDQQHQLMTRVGLLCEIFGVEKSWGR